MASPGFVVVCRGCDSSLAPGPHWWGCDRCKDPAGFAHWLEVRYSSPAAAPVPGARLWDHVGSLPAAEPLSLGEGNTPLLRINGLNAEVGLPHLYLKLETLNPTGSFKDRAQSVAMAVARDLGYRRAAIVTTGNAGVAAAAYAALAGIRLLVITTSDAPEEHLRLMNLFGAVIATVPGSDPLMVAARPLMEELVRDHACYPTTVQGTYAGPANPYGVEGYRTISFEITAQLGRVPDRVCVPTSGGDALYGIHKGFRELRQSDDAIPLPRMTACQAAGAAFAVEAVRDGLDALPTVTPTTIASSIGDPTGSHSILEAIRTSDGDAWAADDEQILEALALLGRYGICVEAASATPLAAIRSRLAESAIDREETIVAVLTGTGMRWPGQLDAASAGGRTAVRGDIKTILAALEAPA